MKVSGQERPLLPGVPFVPLHPDASDPELACWFAVEVEGAEAAERVVRELRQVPGVEAAYVKPADTPPG